MFHVSAYEHFITFHIGKLYCSVCFWVCLRGGWASTRWWWYQQKLPAAKIIPSFYPDWIFFAIMCRCFKSLIRLIIILVLKFWFHLLSFCKGTCPLSHLWKYNLGTIFKNFCQNFWMQPVNNQGIYACNCGQPFQKSPHPNPPYHFFSMLFTEFIGVPKKCGKSKMAAAD